MPKSVRIKIYKIRKCSNNKLIIIFFVMRALWSKPLFSSFSIPISRNRKYTQKKHVEF